MEAKAVVLIQILTQSQTTKVAVTKKRIVDLIRTVLLNTVNKRFLFKKPTLNKYTETGHYIFPILLVFVFYYSDFYRKIL